MFLDGCSVEEYTRLQVRDQVAIATKEVTEMIRKNEGFEDVTLEMVKEYW